MKSPDSIKREWMLIELTNFKWKRLDICNLTYFG